MGGKITELKQRAQQRFADARGRYPALDHLVRAKERYDDRRGDRLAGAVTYFGFLSFFPLIALAFAVLGYAVGDSPEVRTQVERAIAETLPGLSEQIDVDAIADAKAGAGIFGVLGLLWAGTGWVDALREALRSMWLQKPHGGPNLAVKKAFDVLILAVLGLALLASVAVTGVATSATTVVLGFFGLEGSTPATWLLRLLALAVGVASSAVIFTVMYWRLSGMQIPRKRLIQGALLGAVGFEVLKLFGTFLVGNTTKNPVYATFAVAVGLLIWINLVTRVALWAAAWTATQAHGGVTSTDGAGAAPSACAVPAGRRRARPRRRP